MQDLTLTLATLLPVVSMNSESKDQTDFSVGLKVLAQVSFVGIIWDFCIITFVALFIAEFQVRYFIALLTF